jgi:hypothetical protein
MVDDERFIKSYDTNIIIHKTNGQDKYMLMETCQISNWFTRMQKHADSLMKRTENRRKVEIHFEIEKTPLLEGNPRASFYCMLFFFSEKSFRLVGLAKKMVG